MKSLNALACAIAAAILCLTVPVLAAIQLVPVVSSGLSSPLFVGHAGDGSNRLFIVERAGIIKVLQPGSSSPTVFLDIRSRITSGGGEQGLLGLAFHPSHVSNGRFFVFYTRVGDGALIVAEYGLTGDRDVANPAETVILTIPHPGFTNHNGGMLAFGPDDYLYIGVGDGGGVNDPPNNAQNINVLLGKLLRIDIDTPQGGDPYSSPSTNPFFGTTNGEDEIFAYGLRNPWRFSFDRDSMDLWLADVGQGAFEEVNTPITIGGNYGWKRFEGFDCTSTTDCDATGLIFPVFDYTHSGGRCSITGGYVYRGAQGALTDGTYVYGDFCSGEILGWNGSTQSVLLDTAMSISSFGEDEAGELLRREPWRVGESYRVNRTAVYLRHLAHERELHTDGRNGQRVGQRRRRLPLDGGEQCQLDHDYRRVERHRRRHRELLSRTVRRTAEKASRDDDDCGAGVYGEPDEVMN